MNPQDYNALAKIISRIDPAGDADCLHDAYVEFAEAVRKEMQNQGDAAYVETRTESPKLLVGRGKLRAIDERRRMKRRSPEYLAQRCEIKDRPRPIHEDDPVPIALEIQELKESVRVVLNALPPHMQKLARLFWWEQLTPDEIAEQESRPVATIYSRLRCLKKQLAGSGLLRSLALGF